MKFRNLLAFTVSATAAAVIVIALIAPRATSDQTVRRCPQDTSSEAEHFDDHRLHWHTDVHQMGRTVPMSEELLLSCIDNCFKQYEFRRCTERCLEAIPEDR